jgi:hypothetical protein
MLSVLLNSGAVPPLLSENLSGEGAALTRRTVASAHTVGPAYRASPAPTMGAARGGTRPLPGGRGIRASEASGSGETCDGPAITRGGPGPPWGVRVRGSYPRALLPP